MRGRPSTVALVLLSYILGSYFCGVVLIAFARYSVGPGLLRDPSGEGAVLVVLLGVFAPITIPSLLVHLVLSAPSVSWSVLLIISADWPISILATFFVLRAKLCRKERVFAGRCWTCGYNLTGNASGVCPECGTSVPPTHKVTA